jgi:hypothetical protein
VFPVQISLADLSGFVALVLAGISSAFMVLRGRILKITKNLSAIRSTHIAISAFAGIFIVIHVSFYIKWPINFGIVLGYATFAVAIVVWLTGTAFLERVRDSLLFHSSLSIVFIGLALIHAAQAGVNIPQDLSELILVGSIGVLLVNAGYQLSKMRTPKMRVERRPEVAPKVGQT